MPALSSTMTEGKVVSWSKKVGDKISSGDMVLVVESDKADMDVESYEDGFLAAIIVGDGEVAPVGTPVGLLAKTAADIPAVQAYAKALKAGGGSVAVPIATVTTSAPAVAVTATSVSTPTIVNDGRVVASGYAKAMAKEANIDLRTVTPSRSDGLITAKDLANGTPTTAAVGGWVPAAGTINASPTARKYALENNLDVTKIKGTGNFGRVTGDDVLIAAGKKSPVVIPAPVKAAASATPVASTPSGKTAPVAVLDGVVAMDGMQKAVAKNMEKTLSVPIFRVSR